MLDWFAQITSLVTEYISTITFIVHNSDLLFPRICEEDSEAKAYNGHLMDIEKGNMKPAFSTIRHIQYQIVHTHIQYIHQ